ncbi:MULTISPECIES: SDR family oxidoreductase [Brevibacillus]|jgi:3-oxoacyl-[acyl-carrier protein] reductase|uniref:Short-chain dehydrogenase n=1 Tax=Brevibacillus parabrevis TaxID=54914 RepID=A0A4Y3PS85_BREPA|nr:MULTISPECIES: SDR family oxidoreductase [Brevibacillus]MED2253525.1 SDR family oxidoreductase [Brevibacillus parabrevis]NRQ56354.1 SDR family oxidoreductase [Brevibacillus sp. HD1.4A]RNB97595.1 SDR family oxidoreductase [Brevibacillus parabrevis]UED69463.1 SDR family oxidoreductase [Brevibacillus sp. HD3.3A]WDV95736.1 SDR family oxidoreductase [Brevibacillus parabrevis]
MSKLNGKIALVTGASRGIGRGIALRLAQDGALVAVHYGRRQKEAEEVVQEIEKNGGAAFAVGADLRTLAGIHDLFAALDDALIARTGERQFDILVNNAGIGQILSLEEATEESFDEVMSINVKGPFFVIQQALSRLKDGGRIINLSSFVTRVASPTVFAYSVSKGAMDTLTLALAKQLGSRHITVNAIQPGIINTEMNAGTLQNNPDGQKYAASLSIFNRWGEPEDVADIASFLASPDSRWVTGQLLDASGGSRL